MNSQIFELKNVDYLYLKKIPALDKINLSINKGDHIAILGANGSGKSTLLKMLDGLIFPSSGTIKAFGEKLNEELLDGKNKEFSHYFRSNVGFIFQNSEIQLFSPTVLDEIKFGPLQLDITDEEIDIRVNDVITMLGIEKLSSRSPYTLSGGEKKKVAIASVLSINPDVLLIDEPTNGLDPRTQRWLIELLIELKKMGKTIVIATHDLELAEEVSDYAVVFNEEHNIVRIDKTEKILEDTGLLMNVNLIHEHSHRHKGIFHKHLHIHTKEHEHTH